MSGHSKWSTIKNKKEKADGARAKVFTKIGREIYVAVKQFGPDVESNRKLRDLVAKAKANNVPNDNIERVIKKAAGDVDKNCYEEVVYEGYGPAGVAILVETLTDNRNRTASNLRHYFDKFGGKLSTAGCVSFMFEQKGFVVASKANLTEEMAMEDCFEIEASVDGESFDFEFDDGELNVLAKPTDVDVVVDNLKAKGYEILLAEVKKLANNLVALSDEESSRKLNLLVQALDDDDDVQQVWTNLQN